MKCLLASTFNQIAEQNERAFLQYNDSVSSWVPKLYLGRDAKIPYSNQSVL